MSLQLLYNHAASSWMTMSLQRTSTSAERPIVLSSPPRTTDHSISRGDKDEIQPPSSSDNKEPIHWAPVLAELALTIGMAVLSSMLLSLLTRRLLKGLLPSDSSDDSSTGNPDTQIVRRLRRILLKRGIATLPPLTSRELQMADDILDPDDIEDGAAFCDIGGLDAMKQELYELAIVPLIQPELFVGSKLRQPPKGVLLYGPPGTGKTMLAKALAKEAQAVFLPLQLSKILNKYWGESNKLIAATFSLANKLQPTILFIDELDTFLKSSPPGDSSGGGAFMDAIKAEFLTLWDGVATRPDQRVLVLGATNQPHHIDAAILRRLPRAFGVPLPDCSGRRAILHLLLRHEAIDATVLPALHELAERTDGYSGSDLKELCKAAAMVAVQEHAAEFARRRVMGEDDDLDTTAMTASLRPMGRADLLIGLHKVRRTGEAAQQYGQRQASARGGGGLDRSSLQSLATLLRSLSQLSTEERNDDIPNL